MHILINKEQALIIMEIELKQQVLAKDNLHHKLIHLMSCKLE